ncbi:hypothetical protein M9H77_13861 [Catharanthus roseus]|uniref:Uncharacterized protein n=1 Tax=Catharanthus roseus TaxID=4058 RepID=A0ACC0BLN3_CATRO|nr:hypothetical protein M9H77_13861 [Catharanthus roseus]
MEKVPAHVHPSFIVPNVLSRKHEHRFGLIWSGDHETCFTNLQSRRFGRNLFQCYSTAPPSTDYRVDKRMMTSMLQEVDDMASVVIQEPPSSPSQMAVFAKKGACRQPGRGVGGGRPHIPPFPSRNEHVDPGHVEVKRGQGFGGGQPLIDPFDSLNLGIPSFSLGLTPPSQSLPSGFGTLQMPPLPVFWILSPPPPSTAGSSTTHQPISQASSSDEEERTDDTDVVQHLRFRHRVGKKTTRFTLSDWP